MKHTGRKVAAQCIVRSRSPFYKRLHVKTPQWGGGRGCHPLPGVGRDWVEPSDRRRPEERLIRGAAGGQKAHAPRRAALLEEQVGTSHTACPWAICSELNSSQSFFFVRARLLIILVSEHLCSQVKNGIWSVVSFLCCASAAELSSDGANTRKFYHLFFPQRNGDKKRI